MTELSPQAQVVWDAAYNTPEDCPYEHGLAAALEAVADQVVPELVTPWNSSLTPIVSVKDVRSELLTIAAELRGRERPGALIRIRQIAE